MEDCSDGRDGVLRCPRCQQEATVDHLRESPECASAIQSLHAIYRRSRRTSRTEAGGRPVTLVPCTRCGRLVTKTEARRGHGCRAQASAEREVGK